MFDDMPNEDDYQPDWKQRPKRRSGRRGESETRYETDFRRKPKRPKFHTLDDYDADDFGTYRPERNKTRKRRRPIEDVNLDD
jgi:hypothetical protein